MSFLLTIALCKHKNDMLLPGRIFQTYLGESHLPKCAKQLDLREDFCPLCSKGRGKKKGTLIQAFPTCEISYITMSKGKRVSLEKRLILRPAQEKVQDKPEHLYTRNKEAIKHYQRLWALCQNDSGANLNRLPLVKDDAI